MSNTNYVVGLDFSECGQRALTRALRLARGNNVTVHIAHAVTQDDMGAGATIERQDHALQELPRTIWRHVFEVLDALGMGYEEVPVSLHVRLGAPVDVIRQVAIDYDADLVIVGTHGRRGVRRIVLGSVAESLSRDGHFAVLIAHENRLAELDKTVLPDGPAPAGEEVFASPTRERPHIYRSTLISAWGALGRPTRPSLV